MSFVAQPNKQVMTHNQRRRTVDSLKLAVIVLYICSQTVHAKPRCKYDEFIIEDLFGNKSCVNCPSCPLGHGLTPQCGSTISYGRRFRCEPCKAGITYSTSNDISSCKPCGICTDHMKQISNCTPTNNSKCGKNCDHGFYYSSVTFDCQECSWCCKESQSSPIKDCQGHGIPFYKQCSADDAVLCQPKCTNKQFVFVDKFLNRTCIDCPKCPVGEGLSPKCSSVITPDKKPKCVSCIPGMTFSDVTDSSTCTKCSKCEVGKKIERLCNTTHDILCGDCMHGFYNDAQEKNTIKCKECSYCCGDSLDVRVPECEAQGLTTDKQCAYTTRAVTKCHPLQPKSNYTLVIVLSVLAFVSIIIVCGVCYCYCCKTPNKYKPIMEAGSETMLEDVSESILGKEKPSSKSTTRCICFPKSGVKIECDTEDAGQEILDKVSVEVCHFSNQCFPELREQEVFLSPVIKLHPQELCLENPVKLHLFHSAHVVGEEIDNWSMTVHKSNSLDDIPSEWTNLSDLKNIDVENGWVELSENELGSYVVVGTPGRDGKLSKKRMCCAVFGKVEPRVDAPYSIKLYFIDDCEPSFKKLEYEEGKEDRQLLASLSLFHPDIHPKSNISLDIKSLSEGFTMSHHPLMIYSQDWLHSYKKVPQFEATFVHQEPCRRDFNCTFIVKLNDAPVMEIPVMSFFVHYGSQTCSSGVQVEDLSSYDNQRFETTSTTTVEQPTVNFEELFKTYSPDKVEWTALVRKLFPDLGDADIDLIQASADPKATLSDMVKERKLKLTPTDQDGCHVSYILAAFPYKDGTNSVV